MNGTLKIAFQLFKIELVGQRVTGFPLVAEQMILFYLIYQHFSFIYSVIIGH